MRHAFPAMLAGVSCLYFAAFLFVAFARIRYPYELEWLEGAVLQSASHLLRGLPMYPPPSLSYTPLNYPPLYFMVSAAAMRVLGEGFAAMRAVSLVSALALFAMAFAITRRATGHAWAGWLAVGLFAACFHAGGGWLDVGRLDSLSLALLLGGTLVLDWDRTPWRGPIVSALLVVLSFLAKPTTIVMFVPVVAWSMFEDRRRGIRLGGLLAVALIAAVLALDAWSAGGYSYYTFSVASRRPFEWRLFGQFPIHDFLLPLAPALAVIGAALAVGAARHPLRPLGTFASLVAGAVAATWVLRTHIGCFENVLMPVHLSVMVLAAVAYARLVRAAASSHLVRRLAAFAGVALVAQLVILVWNPRNELPTAADRAEGDALVANLRRTPGRVLFSSHPYLLMLAGKPEHVHVQCFMDVVKGAHGAREQAFLAEMRDSLRAHVWDVLLLDSRDWLTDEARLAGYRPAGKLFRQPDTFWPRTGMMTRPEEAWVPSAAPDSLPPR
jgi:dolichyl-phosphate-mannose-protein mannosyltransferase